MYVIRVEMVNGLHLEYNYQDLNTAESCRVVLAGAFHAGDKRLIYDDAGRSAEIDGSKMQALQMVDVQMEAASIIKLGMIVRSIQQQLDPPVTRQLNAGREQDGAAGSGPVIGGMGHFAS